MHFDCLKDIKLEFKIRKSGKVTGWVSKRWRMNYLLSVKAQSFSQLRLATFLKPPVSTLPDFFPEHIASSLHAMPADVASLSVV